MRSATSGLSQPRDKYCDATICEPYAATATQSAAVVASAYEVSVDSEAVELRDWMTRLRSGRMRSTRRDGVGFRAHKTREIYSSSATDSIHCGTATGSHGEHFWQRTSSSAMPSTGSQLASASCTFAS